MDLINNDTGDEEVKELNEVNIFNTNSTEQQLIKKLKKRYSIIK